MLPHLLRARFSGILYADSVEDISGSSFLRRLSGVCCCFCAFCRVSMEQVRRVLSHIMNSSSTEVIRQNSPRRNIIAVVVHSFLRVGYML